MTLFVDSKRKGLYLLYCLLGSILSIAALSFFSTKANRRSNGFVRLAPPHIATPAKIKDLHFDGFYLAGGTQTRLYLANHVVPGLLLQLSHNLTDSVTQRLSLRSAGGRFAKALRITVDSPVIALLEGVTPTLVYGRVGDSLLHRTTGKCYFNLAAPLSPVSTVFRMVDSRRHENTLVKQLNDSTIEENHVLEKQVDGIFCTDGALHSQPDSNRLVYIYNYRNQFICMDTNMQVIYRAKTIDTISRVKFKVDAIPSKQSITFSSPPQFINEQSCINGNYLFIHSALHADNEELDLFQQSSPIDVYSLKDGDYLFSFYLPDFHHKKIREFRVYGNTLIALYDHYLYSFSIAIPPKLKR